LRNLFDRFCLFFSKKAIKIPNYWLKKPTELEDKSLCFFVTYAANNQLSRAASLSIKSWNEAGYLVILIINTDEYPSGFISDELDFCEGVLIRKNLGYDFGAWATTIQLLPDINLSRRLVCVNDSLIGPVGDFKNFLYLVDNTEADVIGAIESKEIKPHIQSFMIFYNSAALRSCVFWDFWGGVKTGNRGLVIRNYELRLSDIMTRGGLTVKCIFPAIDEKNPMLFYWKRLFKAGFPFIKIALLKNNPWKADINGWRELMTNLDYDLEIVDEAIK